MFSIAVSASFQYCDGGNLSSKFERCAVFLFGVDGGNETDRRINVMRTAAPSWGGPHITADLTEMDYNIESFTVLMCR